MFKVTRHDERTLVWWLHQRNQIDMAPEFQRRGGVWSTQDKAFLIDSILNDFDIPKLYVADFSYFSSPLNKANRQYAVIDGRQRFEAVFDFFDDRLSLSIDFELMDSPDLPLAGLTYSQVKKRFPSVASKFDNFNLHVMSVISDDVDRIKELFVRLNRSRPLTGAEIRNAMKGPVPLAIRTAKEHELFTKRISFPHTRGQDSNAAAKLLLFEFKDGLAHTKKQHLDKFVEEGMEAPEEILDRALQRVLYWLDVMAETFKTRDRLLKSQGQVSLYYWLFRNHRELEPTRVYEFLQKFEEARRRNREHAKTGLGQLDADLVKYDNLMKNPNDQPSLEQRYMILESALNEYLQGTLP